MTTTPRRTALTRLAAGVSILCLSGGVLAAAPATAAEPDEGDVSLVDTASTEWSYLADGTDPAAGDADRLVWTGADFDDAGWASAQGSFGAKNGAATGMGGGLTVDTLLPQYLDGVGYPDIPTYFFRTSFDLTAEQLADAVQLEASAVYDDAMTVYLNGERVAGFDDGELTENVQYGGSNGADPKVVDFPIDTAALQEGANTLAVAVHQGRENSSDVYFDFRSLTASADGSVDLPPYAPTTAPDRIVLTPTETPETSQAVTWRTDASVTEGELHIRKLGEEAATTVPARTNDELTFDDWTFSSRTHSAIASGLTAGTDYEYRVGTGDELSEWYSFSTATADDPFEFIYFGDAQNDIAEKWSPVVDQAFAAYPDAMGTVNAGDLINTSSADGEWGEWFEGMEGYSQTANVIAAPGNHEYSGDSFLRTWKSTFEYPLNGPKATPAADTTPAEVQRAAYEAYMMKSIEETVYYTDYQDVRFIALNASRGGTAEDLITPPDLPACEVGCPDPNKLWLDLQARWLDSLLADNPMKWAVATFHQPVFSTAEGRDEKDVRDAWLPVFQSNDIDLVLMGHDHTYARGYVDADATETPGITTGPVYAVSVSGPKYYEQTPADDNVWTQNGATQVTRAQHTSTFQGITVDDDTLTYRSVIAAKDGESTAEGEIGDTLDAFTITKYDDGTKYVTEEGVAIPEPEPTEITAGTPTITGTPAVGSTLTAETGEWSPFDIDVAYQWAANRAPIDGATEATYTPTRSDRNKTITVAVTGSKEGYTPVTATSEPTAKVALGTLVAPVPAISGVAKVGQVLTAEIGDWTPGTRASYSWAADGRAIRGATKATYTVANADRGKRITLTVTGSQAGYGTVSVTSAPTRVVAVGTLTSTKPTIAGKPEVGSALRVRAGEWEKGAMISYRWLVDGKPAARGTGTTYTVKKADAGSRITVQLTARKAGFTPVTKVSAAVRIPR